ncbi:MAG: rane protein of unknown function [Candidatus Saccharibacteria bacterium]|nr:rane protein of unknown function [Candidatus Saccharibacteria bacterium]
MAEKSKDKELDSVYVLKIILFLILGSLWVKLNHGDNLQIPVPVGFIFGLLLATHEHFQIDRKIEFAVLIVAMFMGFWLPLGIYIGL